MKVILVFVSSIDGKLTKWNDSRVKIWTSKEDQQYFKNIMDASSVIVMGSKSFKADHPLPGKDRLIVVMTSTPVIYQKYEIKDQLEFWNISPQEIVDHFKNLSCEILTLLGGAQLATSFFKEKLIDELWLTIEPQIFGSGENLIINEKVDINLRLLHFEKVNERGTLITKYEILK